MLGHSPLSTTPLDTLPQGSVSATITATQADNTAALAVTIAQPAITAVIAATQANNTAALAVTITPAGTITAVISATQANNTALVQVHIGSAPIPPDRPPISGADEVPPQAVVFPDRPKEEKKVKPKKVNRVLARAKELPPEAAQKLLTSILSEELQAAQKAAIQQALADLREAYEESERQKVLLALRMEQEEEEFIVALALAHHHRSRFKLVK